MSGKKELGFEERLKRLQEIVRALEADDLPLEDGVALYKEGAALAKSCREKLDKAKNEIQILRDGEFREFEPAPEEE